MEIFLVSVVALVAAVLTLFSGFGLGTLLMPVIAVFFPVEIAIAITAMVHLANNVFKVTLLGKHANGEVVARFGIPAVSFAFLGAFVLGWLSGLPAIFEYSAFHKTIPILPIKLIVGLIIIAFVFMELSPRLSAIALQRKYLPYGGAISGFFGGLSGHQGAFRSLFLLKAGLSKEEFIATGVLLAVMVDMARLLMYGREMSGQYQMIDGWFVVAASVSAFAGTFFGSRILKKITIRAIQTIVSVLLIVVALGLMSGLL